MKIIRQGDPRKAKIKDVKMVTCPKCDAMFEADHHDWVTIPNGKQAIPCPCCDHYILFNDNGDLKKEKPIRDTLIDEIIECMDTERIHKVMESLDWHWYGYEGIPTEDDIRENARNLLKEAFDRKTSISTGGFTVMYEAPDIHGKDGLSISFAIDNVSAYITNDNEIELT